MTAKPNRIKGVDICRSFAIGLAMLSHVLVTFRIGLTGEGLIWIRFVMQMAPVVFIILFGSMLEIAYLPKFRQGEAEQAVKRLLLRSGQCYLLYALSVLALMAAGHYSVPYGVRTIMLLGVTPFTDILKFYALALLLAPAVIGMRWRFGLWPMVVGAFATQALYPLIAMIRLPVPEARKDYFGPPLGFLYGGSEADVGAPSLLHGMSLVLLGVVIGWCVSAFLQGDTRARRAALGWTLTIFLPALAVIIVCWTDTSQVLRGIVSLNIRNDNHPFYYALGTASTIAFLALCLLLFDVKQIGFADGIRFLGNTSLFTFCFGNVLLYLQPWGLMETRSVWLALVFSLLITAQSYVFAAMFKKGKLKDTWLANRTAAIIGVSDNVIRKVSDPLAMRALRSLGSSGNSKVNKVEGGSTSV